MNDVQRKARTVAQLTLALTAVLVLGWIVLARGVGDAPRPPEVPPPVVERAGPAPKGDKAAQRHAQVLDEGKYNAAFAANGDGAYGWGDHFARIEDAEAFALAQCAAHGTGCRVVLRILPASPVEIDGQPLSRTAAEALRDYPGWGGSKAIALTGHGGWGAAWNRRGRREAVRDALENCRAQATIEAPELVIRSECRILWAH